MPETHLIPLLLKAALGGGTFRMFGTDYPHHVTTWPHSQEVIEENCAGFPDGLMRKLGRDNAIRIYDLDR